MSRIHELQAQLDELDGLFEAACAEGPPAPERMAALVAREAELITQLRVATGAEGGEWYTLPDHL